jgi:hypothetical protein
MSRRCTLGRSMSADHRNREIDLALAVMCTLVQPGERVPYDVIAEVTGMSHGGPWAIEKSALRKIRNRLRFGKEAKVYQEIVA